MSGNVPKHCNDTTFLGALDCGSGVAANKSNQSANVLFAAIASAAGSFGVQLLLFLLFRIRLARIYRPRSYLVPEKERVPVPPRGMVAWLGPLFTTPNLAFIQKCGLDAYFFLRYLRMLLKIFFPITVVVLPILLPINKYSGHQKGLNQFAISNVAPRYTSTRLWAHLLLALGVIFWVCYVVYRELRGYIRVRQAFLTSPQHRIRASATTVLVTGIPRKWLTLEALNGLYDVFPGGIRNVWINRNFDELADKVSYRDSLAKSLEDAETTLVKKCRTKHEQNEEQRRKKEGGGKKSKEAKRKEDEDADAAALRMAQGDGTSAGDQHDTPHGLDEALHEAEDAEHRRQEHERQKHRPANPLGIIGQGFGQVGEGLGNLGKGFGNFRRNIVGDVDAGFHKVGERVDHTANLGAGFQTDDELYRQSMMSQSDVPPTPPPKTPAEEREARLQGKRSIEADDDNQFGARHVRNERHPLATVDSVPGDSLDGTPTSETTQVPPEVRMTGPSIESSKPRSPMEIEEPASHHAPASKWKVWMSHDRSLALPSPQPHTAEEDEFPLTASAARTNSANQGNKEPKQDVSGSKLTEKLFFWKKTKAAEEKEEEPKDVYPEAFDKEWDEDQDGEPLWRRYIEPKERETMRERLLSPTWFPSLPLVGKKVDRIYWLRKELARLNLEIEMDQNDPEKFPLMSSAFIQFNHQVAAHMACQTVSHHVPQHMAPRLVEISPHDVIWDNMAVKWWERYIRSGIVLAICIGLIILYAVPVTFTSLLSHINSLAGIRAFRWLNAIPTVVLSIIQGILPPVILSIILTLVPIIFRALVKQQGVATGNAKELGVQQWYFVFLFIQVFLVVTITGGLTQFLAEIASNPTHIVNALAQNLPSAANYFFSYLTVQAMSNSASNLLQVGALAGWFLLGPLLDSTARAKWRRQTTLANVQWGSFFPPFTNFAVIGIVYSVISPLILVFMLLIFSLFWIVYRYNVLYVYQFRNDTGGLLFPVAVNQLFVGLYVMELCLIGYFFISRTPGGSVAAIPEAIIMIVALVGTVVYQWLLNGAFGPLFRYLPITLEDEAVIRDEEFSRAQASKFAPLKQTGSPEDDRDIQEVLEKREQHEEHAEDHAIEQERRAIAERRRSSNRDNSLPGTTKTRGASSIQGTTGGTTDTGSQSWHQDHPHSPQPTWKTDRWRKAAPDAVARIRHLTKADNAEKPSAREEQASIQTAQDQDLEAQQQVGDVLFSGFADELEDLTPDERDLLVRYAFQHSALRAKRPVVWIPRDRLGVSDDEIKRAKKMSTVTVDDNEKGGKVEKTNIWMSNEGTALDSKGRVVFRRSPPDFSNVDLIAL